MVSITVTDYIIKNFLLGDRHRLKFQESSNDILMNEFWFSWEYT